MADPAASRLVPRGSPGLKDDARAFSALVRKLWGERSAARAYGNGRVSGNGTLVDVLRTLDGTPDFRVTQGARRVVEDPAPPSIRFR